MAGRGDFGSEDVGCDMDFLGSYCLFFFISMKNYRRRTVGKKKKSRSHVDRPGWFERGCVDFSFARKSF